MMRIVLDDTGQPQAVLREAPPTSGRTTSGRTALDLEVPDWLAQLIAEAFAAGRLTYDGQRLRIGNTDIAQLAAYPALTYAEARALLERLSVLPDQAAQALQVLLALMIDVLAAHGKVRL